MNLRYYQRQAIEAFFEFAAGAVPGKNPLIVLPTGTGKSLVQAEIVRTIADQGGRVLCVTHQKELIRQNYEEFKGIEPLSDAGIYSAGLKKRDVANRIIFAGIQSVRGKAARLGIFDVILVDEAHLIPQEATGTYRKFLAECARYNPRLLIVGLTATPYRMKGGMLTHGHTAIFHEIIHETSIAEMVDPDHYLNLDKELYLTKPITKATKSHADMKGVARRGGDYVESEMQSRFMEGDLVGNAVKEILEKTKDRKKVLIFTAGIEHAHAVFDLLPIGSAGIVTSNQTGKQNDQAILDFSSGQIKYLVNVNVLTTGYNEKAIDCVVLLRKTLSPGLYVQMVGRGTRLFPGKDDFLVLDFGENIEIHGPIDKIDIQNPNENRDKETGAPVRTCPECLSIVHISKRQCPDCGFEFPEPERHDIKASEQAILSERKEPEIFEVKHALYFRHQKEGKPDSMKVMYTIDMYNNYSEWILLDHSGYPKQKALKWLESVCPPEIMPSNVDQMLGIAEEFFKEPTHIKVDLNEKFPRIIDYAYPEEWKKSQEEILAKAEQIRSKEQELKRMHEYELIEESMPF